MTKSGVEHLAQHPAWKTKRPKSRLKLSPRQKERAHKRDAREVAHRVSEAVTKIYLSLSLCECGDEVPDHANCRAAIKLQLRRIHEAIGNIASE
jgi:hypothetical protein